MKRSALYARVSTDMQRDNYSIPTQLAESLAHIQTRGYSLVGNRLIDPENGLPATNGRTAAAIPAFVDDYTSRELSRPELDAALEYLETFGFDVLVVHALDRLARDPYIRQTLEMEFTKRGAKIEYVLGDYAETAEGEVRKDLDSTFAKWENAKRVERCNRGKRGKAEKGLFVAGRKPYGYNIDPGTVGGLAVIEAEAETVRQIFQWYAEGLSIWEIVRRLNQAGIPTPTGQKEKWGKSSVNRILQNTVYIGHIFYNKNKKVGKKLVERDPREWIKIETTPILDPALFAIAQAKLKENQVNKRRQPARFYLLSGLVFCAECGRVYGSGTGRAGKDRRTTDGQFYRHRMKQGHCKNHMVSARRLEPAIWVEIENMLLDPASLRRGYEKALTQQNKDILRKQEHLHTLYDKKAKVADKRANLTAAYIDPELELSKADYLKQKQALDADEKNLVTQIEAIENELKDVPTHADIETLEAFAAEIRDYLQGEIEPTPDEKRKLLELLHVKVKIIDDKSARIEGWIETKEVGLLSTTSVCNGRKPATFTIYIILE